MKKLLVLLIACLALTAAACGGDDDADDGGGGSAGTTTTEQPAPADDGGGSGEAASVDIPDISFEPAELTVKAGTTVTWTNSDDLMHTVTKVGGPGPEFDSGDLAAGDEFEQTFDQKGTIDYVCTIHAGQEGSVTVE